MDQQELKNVLELHRKWVMSEEGGSKANLSYADLSSADLKEVREDFLKRLAIAKAEVLGLYDAW